MSTRCERFYYQYRCTKEHGHSGAHETRGDDTTLYTWTNNKPLKARELAARYGYEIGCGDNSCWFGSPGGMATNGGCRCLPRGMHAGVSDQEIFDMRKLVRDLAAILGAIAKGDAS